MTAVDRLVANSNSIITTLRQFSETAEQDVVFTWINDDDSIEEVSYANITKFQKILNDKFGELKDDLEGEWVDYKTELELNAQRADYCRRMENNITMSSTVTYDADSNLKWDNRLIAIGGGSDAGMYGTKGYINLHIPAEDIVIPALGNADDITVVAAGIPITRWGALYYKVDDNHSNDSKDENWVFVGYDSDTGIIPSNWIVVASFNEDIQSIKIAGQVIKKGVTVHPEFASNPIGEIGMKNDSGVIKDAAGNKLINPVVCNVHQDGTVSSDQYYPFDVKDIDTHNAYDTSNHKFICPVAGLYQIEADGFIGTSNDDVYRFHLRLNGDNVRGGVHIRIDNKSSYGSTSNLLVVLDLAVGDEVALYFKSDDGHDDHGGDDYNRMTFIQIGQ